MEHEGQWGVWHVVCMACGQRHVAVGPIDMAWPCECHVCGQMAGRAYRRYRRSDKKQHRGPWDRQMRRERFAKKKRAA